MSKQKVKEKIKEAVEKDPLKNSIKKVSIFGSYIHRDFKDDSDVDVLIEFTPAARIGFFELVNIQNRLKGMVGKEVDLLTPESLSKYFREEVIKEAETIYER